jgi:hypothetical protein
MELQQRKVTQGLSPHRAVNTLRLGYENNSVNALEGNNPCLCGDPYKTEMMEAEIVNIIPGGTYSKQWVLRA